VSGIKTNPEREFRAGIHDLSQMLEAMSNTFALSRSVFQKNSQLSQVQTATSKLKTIAAR
jgi:hypothetical protein